MRLRHVFLLLILCLMPLGCVVSIGGSSGQSKREAELEKQVKDLQTRVNELEGGNVQPDGTGEPDPLKPVTD
mgnify:CR=1 FL=1